MNKKAFTLIELLSVIVLLGVISIVVVPNFAKMLKESKDDLYNKQIEVIKTAAKLWTIEEDNKVFLVNNKDWPYVITLGDLKASYLIDGEIKNPKNDEFFSDSTLIYIYSNNNNYNFEVNEESINSGSSVIVLEGGNNYKIEVKTAFSEPGVYLKDSNNNIVESATITQQIYKNGLPVNSIDTSVLANYTIKYTAIYDDINLNKQTAISIRRVSVVDTTPPVLAYEGYSEEPIKLESTSNYSLPSIEATDNYDEEVNVVKIGSFSSIIPGEKKVIYSATDSSGNTSSLEIKFVIKDTIAPKITSLLASNERSVVNTDFYVEALDDGTGIKEYSFDGGITWQNNNSFTSNCSSDIKTVMVKDFAGNIASENIETECRGDYAYFSDIPYYKIDIEKDGWYFIDLYGASGGRGTTLVNNEPVFKYQHGKGAHTSGFVYLNNGEKIYLYVGGKGEDSSANGSFSTGALGGYNGGGNGGNDSNATATTGNPGPGGGGATDIRFFASYIPNDEDLVWDSSKGLSSRIIVASGGGGSSYSGIGGGGGIMMGLNGSSAEFSGGAQISGNAFGIGANGSNANSGHGGSGGGYYGGKSSQGVTFPGGSGGSSFISGYAGVNAIASISDATHTNQTTHFTNKYFVYVDADSDYNDGNGYAYIEYLEKPLRKNTNLDNVRYIRDCANGYTGTANANYARWTEIQAIYEGRNIAQGITPIGTAVQYNATYTYDRITDGILTHTLYSYPKTTGLQCVTIDLGDTYDLDEVALWHYYGADSYFKENVTEVSSDNQNWIIIQTNEATKLETAEGIRVSAYKEKVKTSNILDNVRYIKDCANGNTSGTTNTLFNHWYEIQAIQDGRNIALGKSIIDATKANNATNVYTRITDGNLNTFGQPSATSTDPQCITVDLGDTYDLDEVALWHNRDGRQYTSITYVSSDNENWITINENNREYIEDIKGAIRVKTYEYQ